MKTLKVGEKVINLHKGNIQTSEGKEVADVAYHFAHEGASGSAALWPDRRVTIKLSNYGTLLLSAETALVLAHILQDFAGLHTRIHITNDKKGNMHVESNHPESTTVFVFQPGEKPEEEMVHLLRAKDE